MVACVITPVFNLLTAAVSVRQAVQGVVDALIISLLVGGYLIYVRDGVLRARFRRLGFLTDLGLSSALLLAMFLVGRAAGQVITTGQPHRFVSSFTERHLLYALPFFVATVVAVNFVRQMNRLIGPNVLGYFAAGVYHRPTAEERVFLFVDLQGSTQLAEQLGSARYFELLRRFVDELTEPVLEAQGEIYHGGLVTAGELGDLRLEIVFVGDILNTAARLEEHAKRAGLDLVASGTLLERMALPAGVEAARCGDLALRGKEHPVAAWTLAGSPKGA